MDVKLRTLPTQVAGVLARRFASNGCAGAQVSSEQEICAEFAVSRAVAREALKILRALDMVDIAQGRRVTLRPVTEWDYLSPLLFEWLPPDQVRQLLRELHEARLIFEPEIAAQAARKIGPEDLGRLHELLEAMAANEHDADAYLELDLEFHLTICRATRNRILGRFIHSARGWLSASRRITNRAPDALTHASKRHSMIYEALAAHDPLGAETAMREHLTRTTVYVMAEQTEPA